MPPVRPAQIAGAIVGDPAEITVHRDPATAVLGHLARVLTPREAHALLLCRVQGLSRHEAAVELGVSDRRIEKIMDAASAKAARAHAAFAPTLDD